MESFFRETLKRHVQPPKEYQATIEACTCTESLSEIAYNGRNISLFRVGCERPDQMKSEFSGVVHTCICKLNGSLTFACLLGACRACYHQCICSSSIVPIEEGVGAIPGYLLCKADDHECLCKRLGPGVCIATRQHKCSCMRRPETCRLDREELPRNRNHVCRCNDSWFQNLKCHVHS